MNLADKPVYPTYKITTNMLNMPMVESIQGGLTFRERLIIALASNPVMIKQDKKIIDRTADVITEETVVYPEESAEMIINQADAIIKQLEEK